MRSKAPWFLCVLGVLLVALQFICALLPSTSGHVTLGITSAAPASSSNVVVVGDGGHDAQYEEAFVASCPDEDTDEEPTAWPGNRDRYRPATEPPTKSSTGCVGMHDFRVASHGGLTGSQVEWGPTTTPSLTSLQVFRC
ncbi:hypothetical protein [Streptomyces ochraceiscleroticus]|uniref:Secreted protein n=1 Tax=Streptomyces ochraceiscleroticus TaxID=47761 RepID=A0ABW1MT97_9ACTN|nr:hypothetical protein [Streptomyces ochraceiscleroticus]